MGPRFRPTTARVDLSAVAHNIGLIAQRAAPAAVLVAVKADAYGHGAVQVARCVQAAGGAWLGVATVEEGLQLRAHGLELPILVFGGPGLRGADAMVASDLTAALYDIASARRLNAAAGRHRRVVPVHVQVDTGMSRLGVMPTDWPGFIRELGALPHLHVDGAMTHLAHADGSRPSTARQISAFRTALDVLVEHGHRPTWIHADNSAGALSYQHGFNLVRAGIAVYGIQPGGPEPTAQLRPAMSVHSEVLSTKEIPAGTAVSYGGTWTATQPTRLAVIPIGYGDGYSRALSGKASVLIAGQRAPIRGRVCMDLIMVDVTHIEAPVRPGTPVVLIGEQGSEHIRAEELAQLAGTIGYEVVTAMSGRVPREWVST